MAASTTKIPTKQNPPLEDSKPANRPSRRHEILAAAVDLLAVQPLDQIAVSDIASQASMTPAAFYYHFSSKDEILDEIVADFAKEWAACVTALMEKLTTQAGFHDLVDGVLNWVDGREKVATVYFVTSIGATSNAEILRKKARDALSRRAGKALTRVNPAMDKIRIAVGGVGLITLLEVCARSRLELDPSYRTLGPMRFRASTASLAQYLIQ